jgi:hypothetical protein
MIADQLQKLAILRLVNGFRQGLVDQNFARCFPALAQTGITAVCTGISDGKDSMSLALNHEEPS